MKDYMINNEKKLKYNYETEIISAAAAATAAISMLLSGNIINRVIIDLNDGEKIWFSVKQSDFDVHGVSCCVKKEDAGVYGGILTYAKVSLDAGEKISIKECTDMKEDIHCNLMNNFEDFVFRKLIVRNVRSVCDKYKYYGGVNILLFLPHKKNLL